MSHLPFHILFVAVILSPLSSGAVVSVSWTFPDNDAAYNWVTTLPPRGEEINSSILNGETLVSFEPSDNPAHQDFLALIQGMMGVTPISSDLGRSGSGLYDLVPSGDGSESSGVTFNTEVVFGHRNSIPEPSTFMCLSLFGIGVLSLRKR